MQKPIKQFKIVISVSQMGCAETFIFNTYSIYRCKKSS